MYGGRGLVGRSRCLAEIRVIERGHCLLNSSRPCQLTTGVRVDAVVERVLANLPAVQAAEHAVQPGLPLATTIELPANELPVLPVFWLVFSLNIGYYLAHENGSPE